jgi:hypothetical protein
MIEAGSSAAGNGSQGGSSGGTVTHAGQATAGTPDTAAGAPGAAGAAAASQAGAGGSADQWDPDLLGFDCDSKRCAAGQACIRCFVGDTSSRICVPSPSGDPAGFATATAACEQPLPKIFDECDGPEDCPGAQYCVAAESANGFMRCRDEPSAANGSCCFACGALTNCTLCRSAADCPENRVCEPAQSAPAGIMGCQRPR